MVIDELQDTEVFAARLWLATVKLPLPSSTRFAGANPLPAQRFRAEFRFPATVCGTVQLPGAGLGVMTGIGVGVGVGTGVGSARVAPA
jgi:hypothetical protein